MIGPAKYFFTYLGMLFLVVLSSVVWIQMRSVLIEASHIFLYYICWVVGLITLGLWFVTAFSDPGVLLRSQNYDHIKLEKELQIYKSVDFDQRF